MTEFDWKLLDYTPVFLERATRIASFRTGDTAADAAMVAGLKEYYKTHPADFINDWGMTVDPRNAEIGKETTVPFILFPKQREFIDWLHARWLAREDGLAEKSRDMGVSWLCIAFGVWMWLFHSDTVVGYGSRKEEYVDKLGDPKSLFWKARAFISLLPSEFLPPSFSEKKHAPSMRIVNPDNGAVIVGEAGDNIGRGNRASLYFCDEAAFFERADSIDAALSQTSNCKISVSTPNGNGNSFFRKRFGGKISVFQFRWTDDPRKGPEWYKKQRETLDPVILAQEVDIDYAASVSNAWISADIVAVGMSTPSSSVEAIGGWIIGVDAAHEGDDMSVIHSRRGRLNLPQVSEGKLDGIDLALLVERHCDDVVRIHGGEIAGIVIELDGPGVSAYDQLRRGKYGDCIYGVHTGKKLKDSRHFNLRALLWSRALDYLLDTPCSLALSPEFKSQLASMRYSYRDGMLLMQDKKLYKKDYGRSCDNADAFVLTFADVRSRTLARHRVPKVNQSHQTRRRNSR